MKTKKEKLARIEVIKEALLKLDERESEVGQALEDVGDDEDYKEELEQEEADIASDWQDLDCEMADLEDSME